MKAVWVSASILFGLFGISVLECALAHGYTTRGGLLAINLLVWITTLASFLVVTARVWPVALLVALMVPLATVEFWLLVKYHAQINGHTLTVMLATDVTEARQYLDGAEGLAAVSCLVTAVGIWAAWRLRGLRRLLQAERRALLPAVAAGWLATGALLWLGAPTELTPNNGDVVSPAARNFERVFPWGVPVRLVSFALERKRKQELNTFAESFRFGAVAPPDLRVVVLVIGESSRAANWQLGNYPRETNPQLKARGDVIWFKDYAANAVVTAMSVPLMITRKPTVQGGDSAWPERSIVSAFREAGFQTWWISNQATAGVHDVLISSYAQEAEHVRFINLASYESRGAYDMQLVPEVEQALTGPAKQFIVVHLMGSHHVYAERYPAEEAFFEPDDAVSNWGNAYDNSIRQTDRVLASLIAALERSGKPSALLYASDHGELLRSASCSMRWHGHGTREGVFASAVLWLSNHPKNAAYARAARQNALLPTSSKDVFDSLVQAGGLQFAGAQPANSWLSSGFVVRPRLVSTFFGLLDADGPTTGACKLLQTAR